MNKTDAKKIVATLTREEKLELLRTLAKLPSLKDKVAVLEDKYGIKID